MPGEQRLRDERRSEIIDVWKVIVEVQRHFNDIEMRIRGMFVTILLALFASIGFLLDKNLTLNFWLLKIQFATLIPIFGLVGTSLFYFIDRYWYHRLLVGSVSHAMNIEKKYFAQLPELSLSDAIGKESPLLVKRWSIIWMASKMLVCHEKFKTTGQLHSDGKIELFYKSVMAVLVLTFFMLTAFGGIRLEAKIPMFACSV